MNLATIPLLIVALLMMATSDPGVDTVELVMSGEQVVEAGSEAMLVGEVRVEIPVAAERPRP